MAEAARRQSRELGQRTPHAEVVKVRLGVPVREALPGIDEAAHEGRELGTSPEEALVVVRLVVGAALEEALVLVGGRVCGDVWQRYEVNEGGDLQKCRQKSDRGPLLCVSP